MESHVDGHSGRVWTLREATEPTRRRRRARLGARRGAVLVESVIVIGMIAIFLACGILLHGAYLQKIAVMREARSEAWANAEKGCSGGLSGGIIGSFASLITLFEGSPVQPGSLGFSVGSKTASKSGTASAPDMIGGQSFTLSSETRVACNEKGEDYVDLVAVFQWGFEEIIPGF